MENLILAILIYVAIVAIANCPTRCTTTNKPVSTFQIAKPQPTQTTPDLDALSIRDLKKMASTAKIKRYSAMTKAQLIQALA